MKKCLLVMLVSLFILGVSISAKAVVIDNNDGTITQIREDGSKLMWLKDANLASTLQYSSSTPDGRMTLQNAFGFIQHLNDIKYLGYNDWRLPKILPINGTEYIYDVGSNGLPIAKFDGTSDCGFNIRSLNSEMAYLFYVELSNSGRYSIDGNERDEGTYGFLNQGPFLNIPAAQNNGLSTCYWSESIFRPDLYPNLTIAWAFRFDSGGQDPEDDYHLVWPVRDVTPGVGDGPAVYFRLNGDTKDSSGNLNDGTAVGDPQWVEDRFGNPASALSFDGVDDYLDTNWGAYDVKTQDAYSFSFWIKTDEPASADTIIFGTQSDDSTFRRSISAVVQYWRVGMNIGGGDPTVIGNPWDGKIWNPDIWDLEVADNQWHYMVFSHEAGIGDGSKVHWYLDGTEMDASVIVSQGTPTDIITDIYFSAANFRGQGAAFNLKAAFDDIRIYTRALSSSEVQALYAQENNEPPVAEAGDPQAVHPGSIVSLDGSASSDPNENYPLTYSWEIVSKPEGSTAALSDTSIVNPSFNADSFGDYVIRLIVKDSLGASSESDEVTVSTFNSPPVAEAGPDQAVTEIGTDVQLDGRQSWDDEGDQLTYSWSMLSKPDGSSTTLSDPRSPTPAFLADVHGTYVCQLIVNDSWDVSEADTVEISFENVKPVANAGNSTSVVQGETVNLDGSGSRDANGDLLTFNWSIVSKPEGSLAAVSDSNTSDPTITPDVPGQYVISLTVNDGFENSAADNMTIVAISYSDGLTDDLQNTITVINSLNEDVFKNKNNKKTLTNKINAVLKMVDNGKYEGALNKLQNDILGKTDGCAKSDSPDKNDWIRDCDSQGQVYPLIIDAMELLNNLI